MEAFADILEAMRNQTTLVVQIWMIWMGLIFTASIAFVKNYVPARVAFVAMIATVASVLYIWSLTRNIHLFGVAHILIWFPLLGYLWGAVLSKKGRETYQSHRRFFLWTMLICATIFISLMFDIRDIHLVMEDRKH